LKQKIQQNLIQAVKNKEELKSSVLRMLLAVILNKEKEKRYKLTRQNFSSKNLSGQDKESQLIDEEIIKIVFSEIKKRKEAILGYEKGERKELAEKEKKELEILKEYLPEQLSEEEIKKLVKEVIEKTGASEIKDIGKVMAELMPKVKGKADGSIVSKIAKELLIPNS